MIGIIDYEAGNLLSVKGALDYLGADYTNISRKEDFEHVDKIILPGVGAFEAAIQKVKSKGIYESVSEWIFQNKPFLGICLGLQLLFEESEESQGVRGLGIFKGKVIRFRHQKVPQIGWNQVRIKRASKILNGINDHSYFYFLHSYFAHPHDDDLVVGTTEYGIDYPSIIEKGSLCAVQFHPEKSGEAGLKFLENWVKLC
jgi:imidazole glycerol phosphate synthase glutamine amidotransferase subunit